MNALTNNQSHSLSNPKKIKFKKGEQNMNNPLYDPDYCYECSGYGDDTYIDDNGELQFRCPKCPFNITIDDD